jgi:hypothetical protein
LRRLSGRDRGGDLVDALVGAGDETFEDGAVDREPLADGSSEKAALVVEADLESRLVFTLLSGKSGLVV